VKGEEEAKAAA